MQYSQSVLLTSRYFVTYIRSHWEAAFWWSWSPCNSAGKFVWGTSIWWGKFSVYHGLSKFVVWVVSFVIILNFRLIFKPLHMLWS